MSVSTICAACKREFIDINDGAFITCGRCRRPDTKQHTARFALKGGKGRYAFGRTNEHMENTYETKYGVDG